MISAAAAFNIVKAFDISEERAGSLPTMLLTALLVQTILFLLAYRKQTAVCGTAVCAVLSAAAIAYIHSLNVSEPEAGSGAEAAAVGASPVYTEERYYYVILIVTALVIFLLTRRRWGAAVLFFCGVFGLGAIAFLEYGASPAAYIIFMLGTAVSFIYKGYQKNALETDTVEVNLKGWFCIAAALSAIACLIAVLLVVTVIRPLDPPTRQLRLITVLETLPVVEKMGVSSEMYVFDDQKTTENTNDDTMTSNSEGEEENDTPDEEDTEGQNDRTDQKMSLNGIGSATAAVVAQAVRYTNEDRRWLKALIIAAAAIAALLSAKYMKRRLDYGAWCGKPAREAVLDGYAFYRKKLGRLGIKRAGDETLFEYADRNRTQLERFESRAETVKGTFADMTGIYVRTYYGGLAPTGEEAQIFRDY